MSDVMYPGVAVQLIGNDGNAFAILGEVRSALRKAGVPNPEIEKFQKEATSGDYDYLLRTVMRTVETY